VICDFTRPVPNKILLPPILSTLEENGIERKNAVILIATGSHRPNLGDELVYLVGEEIASSYRIVNHYAKQKETHTYLGKTSRGTDVFVDSNYIDADLKITTGFIKYLLVVELHDLVEDIFQNIQISLAEFTDGSGSEVRFQTRTQI
jgi:nickel-dependent lactate racemase